MPRGLRAGRPRPHQRAPLPDLAFPPALLLEALGNLVHLKPRRSVKDLIDPPRGEGAEEEHPVEAADTVRQASAHFCQTSRRVWSRQPGVAHQRGLGAAAGESWASAWAGRVLRALGRAGKPLTRSTLTRGA